MKGFNVRRGAAKCDPDVYQVHEMFYTIQGEGPFGGQPAGFIRLTGCNLGCHFCDTEWDDKRDPIKTAAGIAEYMRSVSPTNCDLAVITGGEPMRHNLTALIQELNRKGFLRVQIETAGTLWDFSTRLPGVTVVVSPKTAKVHFQYTSNPETYWKYIVAEGDCSEDDGLPISATQRPIDGETGETGSGGLRGGKPCRPPAEAIAGRRVFVQACDTGEPAQNDRNLKVAADAAMRFGYRLSVQVHKMAGLR